MGDSLFLPDETSVMVGSLVALGTGTIGDGRCRIDQVVVNFVNNAVKYAQGSKDIHLHVERFGDSAQVRVTDFGPGISEHLLPNIFDRYYRV